MTESQAPFQREESLDKPGIIGARWWQRSLDAAPVDMMSRRQAVQGILVAGGVIASLGVVLAVAGAASSGSSGSSEYRTESRVALDTQKEYGWSFGATTEALTFDGESKQPFDRQALGQMADDLRPARREHAPWYVPTLFQSLGAAPRARAAEETTPGTPLKQVLAPIFSSAMEVAYRRGKALASLFRGESPAALVVVDLPGPEAVAFAAGAAAAFDVVFAFDNWPHPRGVVPAHLALAAAAFFQPLFAKRGAPAGAPPLVVLDRRRLDAYTDDAAQFDNRHVARLPGAAALEGLGIAHVLYVAPSGSDRELDDLNDDFVLYARAGLDVKLVGADAWNPDPNESSHSHTELPPCWYGSSVASHLWFWHDYPWVRLPRGAVAPTAPAVPVAGPGAAYVVAPRASPFSSGNPVALAAGAAGGAASRTRPQGFGTVPVIVSVATGLVLGAKLFRSGSWNRWSGGSGG